MKPQRIVAIDDDPMMLRIITAILKDYEVDCYEDPSLVLPSLVSNPPNLLITDMRMPCWTGDEVAQNVHQCLGASTPPILVVSSVEDEEGMSKAFEAGADDYLIKPIRPPELRAKVHNLLSRTRPLTLLATQPLEQQPDTASLPGRLGRYKILATLGEGGMGSVLLGQAPDGAKVAIKTLHRNLASNRAYLGRFLREVGVLRQIKHRGLVGYREFLDLGDRSLLVMDYVAGPNLSQVLARSGPLDEPRALDITAQIAETLAYLASQRIVHNDLKLSNIVLDNADGHAVLVDFGLARRPDHQNITSQHEAMGSLSTMSPERLMGLPPDARSDQFSLGATLYALLTGRYPFRADSDFETMKRITEGKADWTPLAERHVTLATIHTLRHMLQPNREKRLPTPESLVEALRSSLRALAA